MKNKAFTLIELLVVVLIIGILAAIALPQYEKAVKKSRATEAKIALSALVRASDAACLANPNYSGDMDELDIDVQDSAHWHYANGTCVHENGYCGCYWKADSQDDDIALDAYSEEYNKSGGCEPGECYLFACAGASACPQYGFTKYLPDDGLYIEP